MRKLVVIVGLLAVFLAACSSGGDNSGERQNEGVQGPGVTAVAPTSVPEPTAVPEAYRRTILRQQRSRSCPQPVQPAFGAFVLGHWALRAAGGNRRG